MLGSRSLKQNEQAKATMATFFEVTLQKEAHCLSSWLTPPNFLSSCHDNARPHTEFSLTLFLSVSIYI